MLRIGDIVKVIGKTVDGSGEEKELIPIGTICHVVDVDNDEKKRQVVEIIPKDGYICIGYWYLACDVEKGHMEWVKDE